MAFDKFVTTEQKLEDLGDRIDLIIVELDALLAAQPLLCSKDNYTDSGSH
jgi:hypothetical protein